MTRKLAASGMGEKPASQHERVALLVEWVGGQRKAAEIAGVSRASIDNWRKENAKLPVDGLLALANEAGVSLDWIATGRNSGPNIGDPEAQSTGFSEDGETFSFVPLYQAKAGAGAGQLAIEEDVAGHLAFRREWLRRIGIPPQHAGLMMATGDSMYPTIPDGAVMLFDRRAQELRDGCIYLLGVDGTVMVKRLQLLADGSLLLISDNPIYERQKIARSDLEQVTIFGRVAWSGHSL